CRMSKSAPTGEAPDWPIMRFSSMEVGLLERAWRRGTSSSQARHGDLGCFRQEHEHRPRAKGGAQRVGEAAGASSFWKISLNQRADRHLGLSKGARSRPVALPARARGDRLPTACYLRHWRNTLVRHRNARDAVSSSPEGVPAV